MNLKVFAHVDGGAGIVAELGVGQAVVDQLLQFGQNIFGVLKQLVDHLQPLLLALGHLLQLELPHREVVEHLLGHHVQDKLCVKIFDLQGKRASYVAALARDFSTST